MPAKAGIDVLRRSDATADTGFRRYDGRVQCLPAPPRPFSVQRQPFSLQRQLDSAQIRLVRLEALRVALLRVLVGDRGRDDHLFAGHPVGRRRDRLLRAELDRVEHAQDLVEVAPGAHRVGHRHLDALVGADDEDRAHRLVGHRGAALVAARLLGRQHVVELRDLQVGVGDHRVVDGRALGLLDVLDPAAVIRHRVDGEADDLGVALGEFGLDPRHVAELGRAHRRVVLRVREQDRPAVADPVVEMDRPLRRFGGEIGGNVVDAQGHV